MERTIVSKECKFVLHAPPIKDDTLDLHYVKEILTYNDGTTEPNFRVIQDFQRPFWITKEHYRRHKDKKESEDINKLNKYTTTQQRLHIDIAARLGSRYIGAKSMRDVSNSPYVYGTDVDSRAIIKSLYQKQYPNATTPNSIAVLDIEVDTESDEMIVISIATSTNVYVGILRSFISNYANPEEQLSYLYNKYIPKTDLSTKIQPTFKVFNTEIDMLKYILSTLHTIQPDFVAIWNIDYDIPYLLKVCSKYKVDPKDIFSDPRVPTKYRYFNYKQGSKTKTTDSGVHKPIDPHEQWHVVHTPCSWYWIDAMCTYYYVRVGSKKIAGGYSLNNVLEKELGTDLKKLKFTDTEEDTYMGIDWHRHMVSNKPLEYVIYNVWDTISILHLDQKTKDLSIVINVLSGYSSYDIFNSGPKKIVDALHFFYLENNRVLATKGNFDNEPENLGLSDWIMILNADYVPESTLDVIEEGVNHNIRGAVMDLDAVSSYPSDIRAANVSKDTTEAYLLGIEGYTKEEFMLQNINLFFGKVNAIPYCNNMFNFPTLEELDILYKENEDDFV